MPPLFLLLAPPLPGYCNVRRNRSKTFGRFQCGSEAYLVVKEPIKEAGMQD